MAQLVPGLLTVLVVRTLHPTIGLATGEVAITREEGFTSWGSGNMHSASGTAFADSLRHFRQGVTGVDLISELYGDDEATLVCDVHVEGVGTVRTAEHFRLAGGRIASNILIFDEWPYQAAKG